MHDRFKDFLFNETSIIWARSRRPTDGGTVAREDAPNLGNRAMIRAAQGVINQIRRILHGRWDDGTLST